MEIRVKILDSLKECISEYREKHPEEDMKKFYPNRELAIEGGYEANSGIDLRSTEEYTLQPGEHKLFKLGVAMDIPYGTEIQIRPRSGLATKHGISIVNTPGTVDANYRGEIGATLVNLGDKPYKISKLEKICQAVHCPVIMSDIEIVNELSDTTRGSKGYGSSGKF